MDQAALLDACARALGAAGEPASDYRIAKELGVTRQYVSKVRAGKKVLGDDYAVRLALLANLDPAYVAAVLAATRATRGESKRALLNAAAKIAGAVVTFATIAIGTATWFDFPPSPAGLSDRASLTLYIM